MDENTAHNQIDGLLTELNFYRNILGSLPVIIYINEFQECGNPLSCRNIWSNKVALEYLGCTQEEITALGYNFFVNYIHPDDLDLIPLTMELMPTIKSNPVFVGMSRIRTKYNPEYRWTYGFGSILETFPDESFKKMLFAVFVISDEIHCQKQFQLLLQEISLLKNTIRLTVLSKREREILELITKGKSDSTIAKELFISVKTVKKHHNNILVKLGIHKSTELVAFAKEYGY